MKRFVFAVLVACSGSKSPPATNHTPPPPAAKGECIKTGCSGTVCAEPGKDVVTTCEMKAEYGCYVKAACERQTNGACGWTETPDLKACLLAPPAM